MQEGTPIIIKKVKKGGHGHHGGAWKVAYADFVTAMMAFFLVMWILGMSDQDKDSVAAYFSKSDGISRIAPRHPVEIGVTRRPPANVNQGPVDENGFSHERMAMNRIESDLKEKLGDDPGLQNMLKSGDIAVAQTMDGLAVELIENETNGEVFFKSGSSEVGPKMREVFKALAPILAESKRLISIEGHTDKAAYASLSYDNWDLSTDRANAVKRLLYANGVDPAQVVGVTGKADTEPRDPEEPYHFSNRRVVVLLPYRFTAQDSAKLPAKISDEAVEGAFRMPGGLGVDLRSKFEAAE